MKSWFKSLLAKIVSLFKRPPATPPCPPSYAQKVMPAKWIDVRNSGTVSEAATCFSCGQAKPNHSLDCTFILCMMEGTNPTNEDGHNN